MTITIPFTLTPKQKTYISAAFSLALLWVSKLITLPPSDQDKALAPLIAILPPGLHGMVGMVMQGLSAGSMFYAFMKAHAGTPAAQLPQADVEALAARVLASDAVKAADVAANAPAQAETPKAL